MKMRTMRLRFIGTADFRKGDRGILEDLIRERPQLAKLKEGDVVMVRSGKGDQILFIHPAQTVEGRHGKENVVTVSERLRLSWGTWSETMVADYARLVGIKLEGLPTLEEIVGKLRRAWRIGTGES
jgi:hypothetical protein